MVSKNCLMTKSFTQHFNVNFNVCSVGRPAGKCAKAHYKRRKSLVQKIMPISRQIIKKYCVYIDCVLLSFQILIGLRVLLSFFFHT